MPVLTPKKGDRMPEAVLDNLFAEFGKDKPYYGSWEWFQEIQICRRDRELCQEARQQENNKKEEEIRAKWTRREYPFSAG